MTPLTLSEMTDSEINEAVALHVAELPKSMVPVELRLTPKYLTDFNAVLRLLHDHSWTVEHVCYEDYEVMLDRSDAPDDDEDHTVRAVAPTLNRAACYALLRSVPGLCKGER